MSLFDFFFPEQAQASHLRRLADNQRFKARRQDRKLTAVDRRIEALEDDLGFVTLVLAGLMETLDEKGAVTREDVRATLAKLDEIDGVKDGKLDVNFLKGMSR